MIVTQDEIEAFERHIELVCEADRRARADGDSSDLSCVDSPEFVANNPHLLMPLGFDEFRPVHEQSDDVPMHVPTWEQSFEYEVFFRSKRSGAWAWFDGFLDHRPPYHAEDWGKQELEYGQPHVHFISTHGALPDGENIRMDGYDASGLYAPLDNLIAKLKEISNNPDSQYRQLVFPELWTPKAQALQEFALSASVEGILTAIANNTNELASVSWRELEEIVAELLRDQGMAISVTKQSKDDGRDVIARGELIPGEPTTLAVEVKHKNVVGLHDLQRALYANDSFPTVLIATSGRFSAGVLREKARERNQLRLVLKDGVALSQWINGWASRRLNSHRRITKP